MDRISDLHTPFDSGRRELLRGGAALAVGLLLGAPLDLRGVLASRAATSVDRPGEPNRLAAGSAASVEPLATPLPRSLSFFNTHTYESTDSVYWCDGSYCEPGLRAIDRLLRDHRTDEVKQIDVNLLDLLHGLRAELGADQPFHVISGYRSPASNRLLRRAGRGVASQSLHLEGRAIDVRLPGIGLRELRDVAARLGRGGVGYYPKSDFVHLDVGSPRTW